MEDIYFGNESICNFCFDQDSNKGITWFSGKTKTSYNNVEVKVYYHVCDKCADLFRKRGLGTIRRLRQYCKEQHADAEQRQINDLEKTIRNEMAEQQNKIHGKRHMEPYTIFPNIVKQFSDEDEKWLTAYGWLIKGDKVANQKIKAQQTYIRNRLDDDKTIQDLVNRGFVNTRHQGFIDLEDIVGWYIWNESERKKIDEIVELREQVVAKKNVMKENSQVD